MATIYVKNLPKEVAEAQLRNVFSKKGEITDVKLLRSRNGRSRQMAFIGFRSEQEAQEAIKYFNKEALAKAGVNVASLEEFATGKGGEKSRSKHILLVKNLPFASTEKELAQMFGKFGIEKIILPPTKTMALVVFLESADARSAIKKMAYKRYKDAPLYLEWAPADILEPKKVPENNEETSDAGVNDMRRVNLEQEINIDPDVTEVFQLSSTHFYRRHLVIEWAI